MPRAWGGYAAPQARIPRTLFQHAHRDDDASFPADVSLDLFATMFVLLPDNWNGTDAIVLWFLGVGTGAGNTDVTIDAATCGEALNTHTLTVANIAVALVANQYTCVDITTEFAALIALLNPRDMLRIMADEDTETGAEIVGIEIQET